MMLANAFVPATAVVSLVVMVSSIASPAKLVPYTLMAFFTPMLLASTCTLRGTSGVAPT